MNQSIGGNKKKNEREGEYLRFPQLKRRWQKGRDPSRRMPLPRQRQQPPTADAAAATPLEGFEAKQYSFAPPMLRGKRLVSKSRRPTLQMTLSALGPPETARRIRLSKPRRLAMAAVAAVLGDGGRRDEGLLC